MTRRLRLPTALVAASVVLAGGASIAAAVPVTTGVVPSETADGGYTSLAPARILDTRIGTGAAKAPIGSKQTINVQVTGKGGVASSNVTAVVINITVVKPTASSGYLTVYPSGQTRPVVSSINWTSSGWVGANLVTVPVGAGGKIAIYNSWGKTNVVGDVMGFYRSAGATPATDGSYGSFEPATAPTRILDTRTTDLGPGFALPPYSWIPVCVDFQDATVNAHIKAVAVNITAVKPTSNGWFAAWNGDENHWPSTSTLNFTKGKTVANMAIVPTMTGTTAVDPKCVGLPTMGIVNGSGGSTHAVVDIVGVFDDNQLTNQDTYRFHKINPVRIVDSRHSLGFPTLASNGTGTAKVPPTYLDADTGGIIANLTAVRPQKNAVVTVWPNDGSTMPWVSNINPRAGDIVANMMITGLGTNGDFNVHNMSSGSTNILVDLVGTFEYYSVAPAAAMAGSTRTGVTPKAVVTGR